MVDFYAQVPKEIGANLEYRLELRKRTQKDKGFRRAMMTASQHDVLFWLNAFVYLHEPRNKFLAGRLLPHVIPFVTWPHQDEMLKQVLEVLGVGDIGCEKSRGEGASWILVLLGLHAWCFQPDVTIGFCSSTEDKADKPGDRGSLLGKLDWELTMLPKWMTGTKDVDWIRNRSDHTFQNNKNNSLIVAHAATAGAGRGHRYLWFGLDELGEWESGKDEAVLASLQHATDSRFIVSTPGRYGGANSRLMHEPSNMLKIVLDWKDNPTKNRGFYTLKNGVPVAVNATENPLLTAYDPPDKATLDLFSRLRRRGFDLKRSRSPWYDRECDRLRATPQSIAQELDRDYGGTMYRIFGAEFTARAEAEIRFPSAKGMLSYHPESLQPEFDRMDQGPVLLWCPLDAKDRPPLHPYVAGADISSGQGGSYTSNSVVTVIDTVTMEQVLEFASNTIEPHDFADFCITVAKWFNDAYLIWEHNGPGTGFTKRILDRRYPNIYYRTLLWKKGRKKTKEAGWYTNKRTKEVMFGELNRSVQSRELKVRSKDMIKECGQYVRVGDRIEDVRVRSTKDDSSSGEAHGDRVIALAVCLQGVRDRPFLRRAESAPQKIPPNSMAARQKEYEDSLKKASDTWDDRTNWDLAHPESALLT